MGKLLLKSPTTFGRLKIFNKNAFIEALNRVYRDDLLDIDDPTIMVQLWKNVFVGKTLTHHELRKRRARDV